MPRRREGSTRTRTVRIGVYLTPEVHTALHKVALDEQTSSTELVERLIRAYLSKRRSRSTKG